MKIDALGSDYDSGRFIAEKTARLKALQIEVEKLIREIMQQKDQDDEKIDSLLPMPFRDLYLDVIRAANSSSKPPVTPHNLVSHALSSKEGNEEQKKKPEKN